MAAAHVNRASRSTGGVDTVEKKEEREGGNARGGGGGGRGGGGGGRGIGDGVGAGGGGGGGSSAEGAGGGGETRGVQEAARGAKATDGDVGGASRDGSGGAAEAGRKRTISERWETSEEAEAKERRALREQLRRRGIRVPPELIEPEARHPGAGPHGVRQVVDEPVQGDRAQPGRVGGGAGKRMLRTWKCEGPACGRWNWPCRRRCHRCGTDRPSSPQRREDWWLESLLPPWAGDEALPPPRDGALLGPGVDGRRVPGLAQPAEGARAGNSRSSIDGQRRAGGGDRRGAVPSVPHPPAARHDDGRDAGDECDGDERPWASVAKKKRKKSAAPKKDSAAANGDLAAEATAAEEDHKGRSASQSAPLPRDLPPMRLLDLPLLPRQTLVRQHQAAAERVERMQERGAKPTRIQKAVEVRQELEKNVRAAGGHTAQALSFSIKSEDDKVEKAERALQKAKEDRAARVELIAKQTAMLEEDDLLIGRLDQRLQAARTRREHLSRQKWAESVSDDTIRHIRAVASVLVPADPAHDLVQRLLELMAPTEEVDMAAGDTESEGGSQEAEVAAMGEVGGGSGSDATRPEEEGDRDGADDKKSMEQVALEQAEAAYASLQAQQRAAMAAAGAAASSKGKRALDADAPKGQHGDEDQEVVRPLTVDQAAALFKDRLQQCGQELDYQRRRVAEQRASWEVDVEMDSGRVVARRGRSSEAAARRQQRRAPAADSSSEGSTSSGSKGKPRRARAAGRGSDTGSDATGPARAGSASSPRRAASDGGSKRGAVGRGHVHEQGYGVCSAIELQQRVRDRRQVLAQERLQAQQEREFEQVQQMAIRDLRVRQAAAEAELRLQAPMPAAPTYGPTGRSLETQQQLMLQAQRLREHASGQVDIANRAVEAEGPRRRTRWQPENVGEEGRHARSSSRSLRPAAR